VAGPIAVARLRRPHGPAPYPGACDVVVGTLVPAPMPRLALQRSAEAVLELEASAVFS
jgi:hypothetical protein